MRTREAPAIVAIAIAVVVTITVVNAVAVHRVAARHWRRLVLVLVLLKTITGAMIMHAPAAITIKAASFTKASFTLAEVAVLPSDAFTVMWPAVIRPGIWTVTRPATSKTSWRWTRPIS